MKKITKWLKDNGFIITYECDYNGSMRFEKDNLKFTLRPTYNKNIILYSLSAKENEYEKSLLDLESKQVFWELGTQKEMIMRINKFMIKRDRQSQKITN